MNTQATQHPPSAIELLAEALTNLHGDTEQDITDAITSIWLPVFKSEQNLAMALEALKTSHDSVNERYLNAMRGVQ